MKIPLFDIDQTLVEGDSKAHKDAYDYAFRTVYGLSNISVREIRTSGMIDKQIILEVLKLHGVPEEEAIKKINAAVKAMGGYYLQHQHDSQYAPTDGAVHLLQRLKDRGFVLGLLTGNIEVIGWQKLARTGMKEYFSFGVFGDMAYKRSDLIPIARERAQKILEKSVSPDSLVIVGDSLLDIDCAKAGGIRVIAVATGHFSPKELADAGADLVLRSLTEEDRILGALG